jgi:hypothetical protein
MIIFFISSSIMFQLKVKDLQESRLEKNLNCEVINLNFITIFDLFGLTLHFYFLFLKKFRNINLVFLLFLKEFYRNFLLNPWKNSQSYSHKVL